MPERQMEKDDWISIAAELEDPASINGDFDFVVESLADFNGIWVRSLRQLDSIISGPVRYIENYDFVRSVSPSKREPIICILRGDGLFDVLDGAHRVAVAKTDKSISIDAIIGIDHDIQHNLRRLCFIALQNGSLFLMIRSSGKDQCPQPTLANSPPGLKIKEHKRS